MSEEMYYPRAEHPVGIEKQLLSNAIRLFQELAGLNPDGVVGERTWRRITEVYADIVTGLTRRAGQFPGTVLRS